MVNIQKLLVQSRNESKLVARLSDEARQHMMADLAELLLAHKSKIITSNGKDLERMEDGNPKKDRLRLTEDRVDALIEGVRQVGRLPDPTGKVLRETTLENGLNVQLTSVPLGVVGVIYESRPNVTVDVAALCLRAGNACVLRGGSEAIYSNAKLVSLIHTVIHDYGLGPGSVQLMPVDRMYVKEMLLAERYLDVIIPRGSQALIDFVRRNSRVPTIETGAGVCHTYVSATANLVKAAAIAVNAKVSRPTVCNALDTLLVHQSVAEDFLPKILAGFNAYAVEILADPTAHQILKSYEYPFLQAATEEDFGNEFLDFRCSVKVVEDTDEALEHIALYSSRHSEAIISEDEAECDRFLHEVDAAAVYANASTRFTDGGEFGLGAEIGISTQKLHARGPFALEKLTTEKWFVRGNGQIRE
ncbi:MAG: glutamate-5-semialdehyde dehydrogenase [Bacteroidota bacterium]